MTDSCQYDLDQYTIDFSYRVIDCSSDFNRPGVFLVPETTEEFEESAVNYMDEGRRYIFQYEEGSLKKYNFILTFPS